jgi:hypothetical protein
MGRNRQVVKTIEKSVSLPSPLVDRMDLELFSPIQGRVPQGAYQQFFTTLISEYFARKDGLL